ncbi:HNH endonuclease signature motif containing protein [Serinibacter arcticus]|uniref:HNH endonuclease signature motif containing protein n=1 Tax=Serinibacter arcticus TaxID=1655435 RepID=UPI00109236D1|nr:HNH endonuclease signature motif containing protein [Serinibacter arcticus]
MAVEHLARPLSLAPPVGSPARLPARLPANRPADPPPPLPGAAAAVGRAVAELAEAIRDVESAPPDPSRAEELTAVLGVLDGAASTLGVARTTMAGLVRSTERWRGTSRARDFADWRGAASRQGRGAAMGEQRDLDAMALLPAVKDAALSGSITHGHLSAVAGVLGGASENARRRLVQVEEQILHAATQLPVPQLRGSLAALATALDADAADAEFHETRARRFLRLTPHRGAIKVEGLLDVVAGETLRTALEALTPAPTPEDGRTPDQRRADALTDLAGKALGTGLSKAGAQIRPHLSVLLREDTFHLLTARRRLTGSRSGVVVGGQPAGDRGCRDGGARDRGAGDGGARDGDAERACRPVAGLTGEAIRSSGLPSAPPLAEMNGGTLLPHAALEVLACDALVQRVVLDPVGQPLDVGRTQRTYAGDLRRAVNTRDRHCQWPGCTLRATWCEVHHLARWADGGNTSLANAITLCTRHHHDVHRDRVSVRPTSGGFDFLEPDGRHIGSSTRILDALLVPRPTPPPPGSPSPDSSPPGSGPPSSPPPGSAPPHSSPPSSGPPSSPPPGSPSPGSPLPGSSPPRSAPPSSRPPGCASPWSEPLTRTARASPPSRASLW